MFSRELTFIDKDELFSPEQREEIRDALKLFEGFARRPLQQDPERLQEVQNIFCAAAKDEKK